MSARAREVLDLFSAAAGGWSLGMHRAGFATIAACESVAWRRAAYAENNRSVRIYDDVRTLTADRLRADLGRLPSIVVGSPPCQDISPANTKGKGVEGERSGLYFEAIRIIGEVRPRWFALENSANLRTRGADAVIAALEAIGYACWPLVVRAGDIGANHERPRAWLVGCDLGQVADADGFGRDEGWCGGRVGFDLPAAADTGDTSSVGRASWPRDDEGAGREADWHEPADAAAPRGSGVATDTDCGTLRLTIVSRGPEPQAPVAGDADQGRNPPHPDQARQAHGCVEPGLRQAEIADDGRGAGRGANGESAGQMGLCPPDRGHPDRSRHDWSLDDLADRVRMDDGLSAWLAGARIQVGDGKGQSATSLAVEALGDAVIPQIPEAIGRAILRTERALAAIYGAAA